MISITKVSAYTEGECNCCMPYRTAKKRDKVYKVYFAFNPRQGTVIRLCAEHLNDLGCQIADTLDPIPTPRKKTKRSVSLYKGLIPISLAEEDMDSGNIMNPRER